MARVKKRGCLQIKIKRFLSYVVEETLKGNALLIKGYTLGLEVFDKDETFDPATDAIVRVEAGRLRRLLEHYYMSEGKDDPIIINLSLGSLLIFWLFHPKNKMRVKNNKNISF